MAGYSGTPLLKKLGVKSGLACCARNAPRDYFKLLGALPPDVKFSPRSSTGMDFIHFFSADRAELKSILPTLLKNIAPDGMIWISWPKKSSGVPSTITEDLIRAVALPLGLVDVKVCAVDEIWSGLKLVIRRENRK
jgi:hypothetical protein